MAPIAGILFADYWLVKRRHYDVPALYNPRGIYRYGKYGTNWRAVTATFVTIIPLLPALANKVNPRIHLASGLKNLFKINWLYGFFLSIALYYSLNLVFPDKTSMVSETVTGFEFVDGVEAVESSLITSRDREKTGKEVEAKAIV
ncbi:hypothetical protein N0V91_009025, partial [Didymella pomorum]